MDYSKTLNLPKTTFPMKANLVKLEPRIQGFWDEIKIYDLLRKNGQNRPKFILHDGPPYANGDIHMGHALNKVLKDIIIKYKSMAGLDSPYIPGWDCHGLPIEYKVMAELKDSRLSKLEIRSRCREYALHYIQIQREEFKRLGVFGDWENPYLTLSNTYSASIIEAFRKIVEKGFIYRSKKPVHWCSSCRTALAEAEVEYEDISSPSIYVRFSLKTSPPSLIPYRTSVLIWTTTPWTLPANLAVAFHPEYRYAAVKIAGEVIIILKELIEGITKRLGVEQGEVIEEFSGRDLEGIILQHPFLERESRGILADFVTKDTGTGCVHIAPGHGLEDYEIGRRYGLDILSPVDDEGRFTEEVREFEGERVFLANEGIVKLLAKKGMLFHREEIDHTYPHCWRCKGPVLFRATEQWFIDLAINDLIKRGLETIEGVKWIPREGRERFYNTLSSRSDWCISRQRAWGVPIPALICSGCGEHFLDLAVIERTRDLVLEKGTDVWYKEDLEVFLPAGTECKKCGGRDFKKEENILDVWFDSGVSHQAVLKENEDNFPADLYLEGSDQHRGWFQSSMLTSLAIEGVPPYRAVLTHGFMLDADGRAMAKSLGNVISPMEIISKYGADILRLWVISADYREDMRLGQKILDQTVESYRKIRNTCRFILGNLQDYNPSKDMVSYEDLFGIDRFLLHELMRFIEAATLTYERFEFHRLYHLLTNFVPKTLSSLYLDIIKDRLYTWGPDSKGRRAAQTVLYEVINVLVRIIAPVASFTAEEVWGYLRDESMPVSIHLSNLPEVNRRYRLKADVHEGWKVLLGIRQRVLLGIEEARVERIIGSSLEANIRIAAADREWQVLKTYEDELTAIFIVSQVELIEAKEFKMEITPARGKKCIRCWNYHESVGKDNLHPEICSRCQKVIEEYY